MNDSETAPRAETGPRETGPAEAGSRAEAVVAGVRHHHHHPADPNVGIVRGHLGRGAVAAAVLAAAVTIAALVLLGLAIGGNR